LGQMATQIRNKARFTVWIIEPFARAIEVWIRQHPGANRTDFVIQALAKKIEREGLKLPMNLQIPVANKKSTKRRAHLKNKPWEAEDSPKRGATVLISTWLDHKIISAMDKCVEKYKPDMNRADFFIEAAAESLKRDGLISIEQFVDHGIRRPVKPEVDQLLDKTVREMRKISKETRAAAASDVPIERRTKLELLTGRRQLESCLDKIDAVLSKVENYKSIAEEWGIVKSFQEKNP